MGPVVVAVDGSESALEAIRFAVAEARRLGTGVRAVHVWHVPEGEFLAGFAPSADELRGHEQAARELLERAVERAAADEPGAPVEQVLRQSAAVGAALVEEAAGAELLVVGSRGLTGVREVLLGSVSHFCCQHAPCPVVVVRHRPSTRAA